MLYSIDHDRGIWTAANKTDYAFYDLQSKMKIQADSLIAKMYGKYFLVNHVIWNVDGSAIYNKNESGNWTDKFQNKPDKFLFRYHVRFDRKHVNEDLIEFKLDAKGNLFRVSMRKFSDLKK